MKKLIVVLLGVFGLLLACSPGRADFWDEFPGPPLDPGWGISNNDSTHWSLTARPGHLQILTKYFPNMGDTMWNSFYHLERITGDFEVSARIVARPDSAGQAAVLYAEYDSTNQGQPNAVVLYGNDFIGGQLVWGTINHSAPNWALYSDSVVYLRLRKHGDTAFAEYSPNGTSWTTLTQGSPFGNHWISGFNAANLQEMGAVPQTPPMAANYDWFHLTALTGVEEENKGFEGSRVQGFKITPNPFASFARVPGHEGERFALYDVSGRQVGTYKGDRIGDGLAPGVYFLKGMGNAGAAPVRIVKVR